MAERPHSRDVTKKSLFPSCAFTCRKPISDSSPASCYTGLAAEPKMRTLIDTPTPNWLRSVTTSDPRQLASFRHPCLSVSIRVLPGCSSTRSRNLGSFRRPHLPVPSTTSTAIWVRLVNSQSSSNPDRAVGKCHTPHTTRPPQTPPPPSERVYTRSLIPLALLCASRAAGVTNLPRRTKFASTPFRISA